MVVTFCEKLGWTYLRSVLDGFSERLTFGVRKDLTELVQIEGIDGIRARAFHNANITTIPTLAITSIDDITKILRSVVPYVRRANNEGLNRWLAGEGLMMDVEAAQILIQRARLHLSSSLRAIGIFSDAKIDSLFSTVTSICETNHAGLNATSNKCDDNSVNSDSLLPDSEFSRDFFMHENFPGTSISKNSKEQNTTASTQNVTQTSKVIKKRPPKMKLPENDNLDQIEQLVVLHDYLTINQEKSNISNTLNSNNFEQSEVIEKRSTDEKRLPEMKFLKIDNLDQVEQTNSHDCSISNQENSNVPDRLNSDNVEQLCMDFAHTSMSDETLLRFGCSQYSGELEQITQTLDAIAVLANNKKCDQIKLEMQQDELADFKMLESLDIFNSIKNETQINATATATSTITLGMQDENVQKKEKKDFGNFKLKKSSKIQSNGSLSTIEYAMSQQITLESIEEEEDEEKIIANSDDSIENRSIFNSSSDLFDRTCFSSISSQSFNTSQKSSHCMKRIGRRSSVNQSPKSPSFQSPLHKIMKPGSPFMLSAEKEIRCNESIKNDTGHFSSNQTKTTEFQITDVCGSRTTWEQLLVRQKYWSEIGLGIAICNRNIIGVALCAINDECVYIDLRSECVSGIEIHERLTALDNILKSEQQKYIYDLLSFSRSLRNLRDTNCQTSLFNHCICVQTLSYLAHYRTLNDDFALSFQDLVSQLTSPERAVIFRNATPRLQAAITAFICLHMHDDLISAAIRLSSAKSVKLELESVVLFCEVEIVGIPFDVNKAKTMNSKLNLRLTEIEAKAYSIAGIPFNFGSAAEISQVLFVRLQIPPPNLSTGRHYSTNKIVLQQLAPKYPIVNLILEWRRINTALTTSLPALLNSCCPDGRIRANFTTYCCTGRVLTVHPNVQNVQKDAIIDGFSIRSLFIASEGRILLSSDYRQLEMRMLAHLSADPQLISIFLAEGDFFEIITNRWNVNETLHIKVDRNKVKQLCYGIIYGMGATSLSKELGIQKQHAQQMIVSFFQQFPKVRTWMDKILAVCRNDKFVSTWLGRRRFLPQINGMQQTESAQAERQAINTCIQGSVAELFKMALLNLQKNLLGTNSSIVMQIHDEVLIETDESSLASVVEIIKHSMTSVIPNLRVPLAVKISFGKSWGELREYAEI
ncbi:unnamed protein product [Onchocerca ochengi]|uniref:DNA-directed DNA polymerase n=1 Tax=Onchocerca ochengi TaxID=42157 RepID=A0A182EB95_ONCOC|nr:unnamed protein product [Onchocerca ochengi]